MAISLTKEHVVTSLKVCEYASANLKEYSPPLILGLQVNYGVWVESTPAGTTLEAKSEETT